MKARTDQGDRVLVGYYSYRGPDSARQLATLLLLFVAACVFLIIILPSIDRHLISACIAVLIAIVAFVLFLARFWAWLSKRSDHLEITREGITYGAENWNWQRIVACRLTRVSASNRWCIIIWTKSKRGPGRTLLIDQSISKAQEKHITRYIESLMRGASN